MRSSIFPGQKVNIIRVRHQYKLGIGLDSEFRRILAYLFNSGSYPDTSVYIRL